jgi:DNA (cytosine-5)-methyltransferase 1
LSSIPRKPDCAWSLADLAAVPKNGITVMSTFACGGGSSMGYKLAGCDVIAANDIDPEMAWHYKRNLNPKHYFLCPIRDLLTMDLPSELHSLDILDGSPPCSTFSMAGSREESWGKDKHFREGQAKQVLSDLFFDYLDLVARLKPRVAIAENVKGMILGNAKGYTKLVMQRLRDIGYRSQLFLINAADCGVPQRRERVFFCAIRDDINAPPLKLEPKHRWVSVRDSVADLTNLSAQEMSETIPGPVVKRWWSLTKPGERFEQASLRAGGKATLFNWPKLDPDRPSISLVANGWDKMSHWGECRLFTAREWIRLGSFPDDYAYRHAKTIKYMIGMSVPPRMTQAVASAVIGQWLNGGIQWASEARAKSRRS